MVCSRGESLTLHSKIMAAYGRSASLPNADNALKAARIAAGQNLKQEFLNNVGPQINAAASFVPSKAELLGYTTASFIFIFGVLGTLFSDAPDIGGMKRTMAGAYMVGAVHVVLLSSIAGNTFRQHQ